MSRLDLTPVFADISEAVRTYRWHAVHHQVMHPVYQAALVEEMKFLQEGWFALKKWGRPE